MPSAFLDSSVLIGLYFRHAGERASCAACLPKDSQLVTSRYVMFEIARGFLRSLIHLHNASFEFTRFADLHLAAYSGQRRFRHYEMHTWLGAMTDVMVALEQDSGNFVENQKLEFFRAKLRVIIQRGWRKLLKIDHVINSVECLKTFSEPSLNAEGRLVQSLPISDCGKPNVCGVLEFIDASRETVQGLADHLSKLPSSQKGKDTDKKHVDGLRHLLGTQIGHEFDGEKCHRCGDAVICLEAPRGHVIASKNKQDFKPIAEYLDKPLVIAVTATKTVDPNLSV